MAALQWRGIQQSPHSPGLHVEKRCLNGTAQKFPQFAVSTAGRTFSPTEQLKPPVSNDTLARRGSAPPPSPCPPTKPPSYYNRRIGSLLCTRIITARARPLCLFSCFSQAGGSARQTSKSTTLPPPPPGRRRRIRGEKSYRLHRRRIAWLKKGIPAAS
jgi:hypothetical protein